MVLMLRRASMWVREGKGDRERIKGGQKRAHNAQWIILTTPPLAFRSVWRTRGTWVVWKSRWWNVSPATSDCSKTSPQPNASQSSSNSTTKHKKGNMIIVYIYGFL
jgi:hypothetical protein